MKSEIKAEIPLFLGKPTLNKETLAYYITQPLIPSKTKQAEKKQEQTLIKFSYYLKSETLTEPRSILRGALFHFIFPLHAALSFYGSCDYVRLFLMDLCTVFIFPSDKLTPCPRWMVIFSKLKRSYFHSCLF